MNNQKRKKVMSDNVTENFVSDLKFSDEKKSLNKFDALDLIGDSNRAVISLGSQEYILRLTKQHKLILTK